MTIVLCCGTTTIRTQIGRASTPACSYLDHIELWKNSKPRLILKETILLQLLSRAHKLAVGTFLRDYQYMLS